MHLVYDCCFQVDYGQPSQPHYDGVLTRAQPSSGGSQPHYDGVLTRAQSSDGEGRVAAAASVGRAFRTSSSVGPDGYVAGEC